MADRRTAGAIFLIGLALTAAGCMALARMELNSLHDAFETDARIIHRLLSQRTAQQDAVMAMLTLLQPATEDKTAAPGPRITAVYPQILEVIQRTENTTWPDAALQAGDAESRRSNRAAIGGVDFSNGRYRMVQAALPASYAVQIDLRAMVPWEEWPMKPDASPVRVTLEHLDQRYVVQPGNDTEGMWRFEFRKRLAADSQPFDVVATRSAGWSDLPWLKMLAWSGFVVITLGGLLALLRQRADRRRAEELLRLGQVARLNALGELAAGMAHELNQPLTAILANTQAAKRLLDEQPPELDTARDAMARSVEQARRASDVVGRMRRVVERPEVGASLQVVNLQDTVNDALYLLEPECRRLGIQPAVSGSSLLLKADPVALEQIIHNLLTNALQALAQVPPSERALTIAMQPEINQGVLTICDSGPGIHADVLPRIFEPFFTTRDGGLGLGLSLCESLAADMGGTLTATNAAQRGALFRLSLPLAEGA
jgi:signal transduction histidine kinase